MAHQQHARLGAQAQEDEPILGRRSLRVVNQEGVLVEEDCLRLLERNTVFLQVGLGLAGIPR